MCWSYELQFALPKLLSWDGLLILHLILAKSSRSNGLLILKVRNWEPPVRGNCEEDGQWLEMGCVQSPASHTITSGPVNTGMCHHTWFPSFFEGTFHRCWGICNLFSSFINHLSPCYWSSSAIFQSCVRFASLFPASSPSNPDVLKPRPEL